MKTLKEFILEGENKQVKGGDPCWSGYEMVGKKKKNGKEVPNCVPVKEEYLEETIRKVENKYVIFSKDGSKRLGEYDSEEAAKKRLKQIEYFKHVKEDWQEVNRKDKTDGLSQKAVNAYRRENPGSKLKTAVTEKDPSGKRAARRKSFCSRMGGMKKRLTNPENARDPDSPINKALRRWRC